MSKQWNYIPKACVGEGAQFQGSVTLSIPTFEQRWSYIEDSNLEMNEEGNIDTKKIAKNIGSLLKLVAAAKKHIVTVDLTKVSTGVKYQSVEDLETDADCDPVLFELGALMINGFRPGKN